MEVIVDSTLPAAIFLAIRKVEGSGQHNLYRSIALGNEVTNRELAQGLSGGRLVTR